MHGWCASSVAPRVRCHVTPRVLEEMFLANGARIGYWRGSIEGVIDDLQVRPLAP